jgi:hypothetical protein
MQTAMVPEQYPAEPADQNGQNIMKKTIKEQISSLKSELYAQSFERKDTSYRRRGGYFGTNHADTSDCCILEVVSRTHYLNTYICVSADLKDKVEKLRTLEDKKMRQDIKQANDSISERLKSEIKFGKYSETNTDGQYFSAGVYRVAFDKYGNVLASIKGGYHDSCPYLVNPDLWSKKVKEIFESIPEYHVTLKCDGSCGDLFLRDYYEFEDSPVKVYTVPSYNGGTHVNMQIV